MDDLDPEKFARAANRWRAKHCRSKRAARKKLREMGMIDEHGNLTPEYGGRTTTPDR